MKKLIVAGISLVAFSGCTNLMEHFSGQEVGNSPARCQTIKSQCAEGHFQTWQTSEGKQGCSCSLSKFEQQTGEQPADW